MKGQDRVLIVTETLPPDPNGVALIAHRTAEILARERCVSLLGPRCIDIPPGVQHLPMRRTPLGNRDLRLPAPNPSLILQAVRASSQVIIHTPGLVSSIALYYARRLRKHTTLFLHNDYRQLVRYALPDSPMRVPLEWAAALVERWAVSSADRVISCCAAAYSKVEVLSIRAPVFPCSSPARLGDGQVTIAYHGRLSPEKAVDATVRAIAAVDPAHDKIRFRIVGAGSLLQSTLSLGHSLGVPVEHVPWCAEPRDHLTTAQIYVTASREETFSISTLEAMGCGLPVIARAVGSIPSYLHHGENGLLFERDRELPDLIRLLVTDENLRLSLGQAARDAAIDKSIWEQFAEASVRN
jgi:glycosyltransferase involved in cell wall biosynthesis